MRVVDVQRSLAAVGADGRVRISDLATADCAAPEAEPGLCVASWRWDLRGGGEESPCNVGVLLRKCAARDFKYLAIDCVSVNQADRENFAGNLERFWRLFGIATIPVVTAYSSKLLIDDVGRAWIAGEITAFGDHVPAGEILSMSWSETFLLPHGWMRVLKRAHDAGLRGTKSLPLSVLFLETAILYPVGLIAGLSGLIASTVVTLVPLPDDSKKVKVKDAKEGVPEHQIHAHGSISAQSVFANVVIARVASAVMEVGAFVLSLPFWLCGLCALAAWQTNQARLEVDKDRALTMAVYRIATLKRPVTFYGDAIHLASNFVRDNILVREQPESQGELAVPMEVAEDPLADDAGEEVAPKSDPSANLSQDTERAVFLRKFVELVDGKLLGKGRTICTRCRLRTLVVLSIVAHVAGLENAPGKLPLKFKMNATSKATFAAHGFATAAFQSRRFIRLIVDKCSNHGFLHDQDLVLPLNAFGLTGAVLMTSVSSTIVNFTLDVTRVKTAKDPDCLLHCVHALGYALAHCSCNKRAPVTPTESMFETTQHSYGPDSTYEDPHDSPQRLDPETAL